MFFDLSEENRIAEARAFAHQIHQKQTYGNSPYSAHTDGVADLIREVGGSVAQIIAGHCHDTWEDQWEKLLVEARALGFSDEDERLAVRQMFVQKFGEEATSIVVDCTDDPDWKGLDKLVRKTMQADKLNLCPDRTKLVKLADCTKNMQMTAFGVGKANWDEKKRRDYLEGNRRLAFACRGVNSHLDRAFEHAYRAAYKRYFST